uniref:Uncharacterized protein n=1 Tax=Aegilops tauschii subsp. strangulata TaxID=200361 RepID=A0A453HYU2_AEGTS
MGKTEPVRKMAQPCHRCPPATPVGHQRRRGAPSRSSRGGEEDTPPDSLFTLWSVYNLFQCSTRCPSQQNLTCRCEILLASLTICFGRSNSTQKGQMICDYFFPTISLGRLFFFSCHFSLLWQCICLFPSLELGHIGCLVGSFTSSLSFSVYGRDYKLTHIV